MPSVMMNNRPPHRGRKGLILIQATMLCRVYEMYRGMAVALRILRVVSRRGSQYQRRKLAMTYQP